MNRHLCYALLLIFTACTTAEVDNGASWDPVALVDPFIGTGAHGHTYPGATVPFGMVQLSPDNGTSGWDWCSGYHYSDSILIGFSHTHLSGTGIGDLGDVRLMPASIEVDLIKPYKNRNDLDYAARYTHEDETASPGYYQVRMTDSDINVELTATNRVGMHRYTFPADAARTVILDLAFAFNWDRTMQSRITRVSDTLIAGYRYSKGWAADQRVYFAIAFSEAFRPISVIGDMLESPKGAYDFIGGNLRASVSFPTYQNASELMVKTAISSASVEGAIAGLGEVPHWDFEQVKEQAAAEWRKELNKVRVADTDTALLRTFYTALYHTNMAPVTYSDAKGSYKAADSSVVDADYTRYDIFSLWDTFRAAHPLMTILQPDRVNDMIRSLLAHYEEYGYLPVWSLLGNETNTMTGYHAIPVIVDAYFKGYRDYDIALAYEAMIVSAMQDIRGVQFFKKYGYIPSELEVESVTKNLEYAYDDWCIAQMAKDLGNTEDYEYFMERAASYRKLFDQETGFMRGKLVNGNWREPFDPKHSAHRVGTDYTEGNAWQHSWFVPHDVQGLISLHGGQQPFVAKLDQLFSEDSEITGENISSDISGLIGQYAHGNEPSHHIAYLYNYAGQPWKTQSTVRQILLTQYNDQPEGLCGNEDCGQMSAWYVFSALGFYPVNPAEGIYVIGSPLFDEASLQVSGDQAFTVIAENNSFENQYIQSATLDEVALNRSYLTHDEIMKGGVLKLQMGATPNERWAVTSAGFPPSMSKE